MRRLRWRAGAAGARPAGPGAPTVTVLRLARMAPAALAAAAVAAATAAAATAAAPAAPAGAATALEDAVAACRALAPREARLDCYEAIPLPRRPAPSAQAAATPATPGATAAPAADDSARFGLPAGRGAGVPDRIRSSVGPELQRWEVGTRIRLANGQVWEVIDGGAGNVGPDNREVTVRRGAMGSFFLDFSGSNNSPRVRRVQ